MGGAAPEPLRDAPPRRGRGRPRIHPRPAGPQRRQRGRLQPLANPPMPDNGIAGMFTS